MEFNKEIVLEYLKTYREANAERHKLEAKKRRCGCDMSKHEMERLNFLAERCEMVEEWLDMLPDDKVFVIQRHLIDEVDFKRIEIEHAERWHEYGKSERTLKRYQKNALEKIIKYTNNMTKM